MTTHETLEDKARRIQAVVEQKTIQVHGLIPMFVRARDYELPTAQDYAAAPVYQKLMGKTEADLGLAPRHVWRAWENTTADTAFYLAAMAYQYRCTADPKALAICRRTLNALKYIYDLAAERGEPGFICKPYGGKYSNQTSNDQIQCWTVGLEAYLSVAPAEDRALVEKMIVGATDELIRDNWCMAKYGYFGTPRQETDFSKGKGNWTSALSYLPLINLAWRATGNTTYLQQIQRWYDACGLDARWVLPKGFPPQPEGTIQGWLGRFPNLYLASLMMEMDPWRHELWRDQMLNAFRMSRTGVLPDGTGYTSWTHNLKTAQTTPLKDAKWGVESGRSGRWAIFARGYVAAQRWLPEENMVAAARTILEGLDMDRFRFVLPLSDQHAFPKGYQPEGDFLDLDSVTAWLWTYWEGRWRGYW